MPRQLACSLMEGQSLSSAQRRCKSQYSRLRVLLPTFSVLISQYLVSAATANSVCDSGAVLPEVVRNITAGLFALLPCIPGFRAFTNSEGM